MNERAAEMTAYEAAKARLLGRIRSSAARGSVERADRIRQERAELAGLARSLDDIASQLRALADRLEDGPAWSALEDAIEQSGEPGRIKAIAWSMRNLASDAGAMLAVTQSVASTLPDPRASPFLPYAAEVFLHLRYRHGLDLPTNYNFHPAVQEFADLLTDGLGAERGVDRALSLLKAARKAFDPKLPPSGMEDFL